MNLCLQSTLLTPSAEDSLSSYYRRLSSLASLPASSSSASASSFPPVPLLPGDVLEVHGGSSTGSSAVLLSCALSVALPATVAGLSLHGCDRSCVYLDCDGRVSMYRLQCMLEERASKAWQQHWEALASSESDAAAGDELRASALRSRRQAVSLLTRVVLQRVRVVSVADEVELMAALLAVDRMCEAVQGGQAGQREGGEQQRQAQMHNIAPYLHDKQRPLFHSRDDEQRQHEASVADSGASLSHARSIACLPLPQPHTASQYHSPQTSSASSPLSLTTRYSPLSPIHSLRSNSPDPLTTARQPAQPRASPAAASADTASGAVVAGGVQSAPPASASVSDVLSALSALCAAPPPPVELLLLDNLAAFYFAAKTADRLSAASASSPAAQSAVAVGGAGVPAPPTVYASIAARLRRVLLDRSLACVASKPPLFASSASSLQSEWRHSEYLPSEYAQLVRWRLLLRMKQHGSSMMDDDDEAVVAAAGGSGVEWDDSGGLRECRLVRCREEEVDGVRHVKNTLSFAATLAHSKEGLVCL